KVQKPVELHDDRWAMCVVVASGGYPGSYEQGKEIFGLENNFGENIAIFHAGTKENASKKVVTSGGRVLGVTALGNNIYEARKRAYWAVGKITFDKAYYRKDIGAKGMVHLRRRPHD
ncbi:hypothetical protein MJD09_06550, partial [bacterium]|nr:hypothetical protein [bacterium]